MRTVSRHRAASMVVTLAAVLVAGLALAGPAVAQTDDGDLTDDDQIVLHGRLIVAADETAWPSRD